MAAKRIVIISDLHISAGALDDCDGDIESKFTAFCSELSSAKQAVELVINGDFLDFVQAPPWRDADLLHTQLVDSTSLEGAKDGIPLCFTEGQSIRKLKSMEIAHQPVFRALEKLLLSHPDSRITILPGNHDADFFWPHVRSLFQQFVCPQDVGLREHIVFHLDQVYRPSAYPGIWIEHGHQYDPCNSFMGADGKPRWASDAHPVLLDKDCRERLYECLGTRFLIKYLNEIDEAFPFVDNVKPFSRFVELFAATALQGSGSFKVAVAMWRLLGFLAGRMVDRPTDLLSVPKGEDFGVRDRLANAVEQWPPATRDQLVVRIVEAGYKMSQPVANTLRNPQAGAALLVFLSDHLELLNGLDKNEEGLLGLSGEDGTLSLLGGFIANETKALKKAAVGILKQGGVDMVIMGHTHERVEPTAEFAYINTGCWTRYLKFGPLDFAISWKMLKPQAADHFPYRLDYVDISGPGKEGVQLLTFTS
jgi:UDP-2,3-diacylglucosamine pyrophosphatase LpxH